MLKYSLSQEDVDALSYDFCRVHTLFSARQESCEFQINHKEEAFEHICALLQPLGDLYCGHEMEQPSPG